MSYNFDEVLVSKVEKALSNINEEENKKFANDGELLVIMDSNPKADASEVVDIYNSQKRDNHIDYFNVLMLYRSLHLNRLDKRVYVYNQASIIADKILNALASDNVEQIQNVMDAVMEITQTLSRLIYIKIVLAFKPYISEMIYYLALSLSKNYTRTFILDILNIKLDTLKNANKEFETIEDCKKEIERLTQSLNRVNGLIVKLNNTNKEQIEKIRQEERIHVISDLNSEKYGFILDLLSNSRINIKRLHKEGRLPIEIKDTQSLIRRIFEFVEDCGIEPMLEIGDILEVTVSDIDGYTYEGTQFSDSSEKKTVEVISSGWSMSDENIVISYPRIKEVNL